jgi:hypothetical protein
MRGKMKIKIPEKFELATDDGTLSQRRSSATYYNDQHTLLKESQSTSSS